MVRSIKLVCAVALGMTLEWHAALAAEFVADRHIFATTVDQVTIVIAHDKAGNKHQYEFEISDKLRPQDAIVYLDLLAGVYFVDVTLGNGTVISLPESLFTEVKPLSSATRKAVPQSTAVSNDADTLDVACDAKTAVAAGANSATPVALLDLAARSQLATVSYPGKLARSVAVDDDGRQALVVIDDNNVSVAGEVRRLAIAGKSITDSGERLAFTGEYVWRVFIAPGAKFGVAIVGNGPTRLVSFSVPGLAPIGSVNLTGIGNAVVFLPAGDALYVRSGSRGIADTIDRFPFDPRTGAIGQTSTVHITGIAGFGGTVFQKSMAITPDGAMLVVADENNAPSPPAPRIAWYSVSTGALSRSDSLPVNAQPRIVATLRACAVKSAIEYHHAAFDHYFATGIADEIAKLDSGTFAGWTRTGKQFNVYASGTSGTTPTCRFFSTAFGVRSSHFYATSASECVTVKSNPSWQFEGEVFSTASAASDGTCASPLLPLYRLYNNGQGGAPNHRYTTDAAVRTQMMTEGWVPEGAGPGVVACVPP